MDTPEKCPSCDDAEPYLHYNPRRGIMEGQYRFSCNTCDTSGPWRESRRTAAAAFAALGGGAVDAEVVEAMRGLMIRFEKTGEPWMNDPAMVACRRAMSNAAPRLAAQRARDAAADALAAWAHNVECRLADCPYDHRKLISELHKLLAAYRTAKEAAR